MSLPDTPSPPVLRFAAILATDTFAHARSFLARLRGEGSARDIELVLVAPPGGLDDLVPQEVQEFGMVRQVAVDSVLDLAAARAAGVRAARAPVVFIAETHAFPRPGMVETILRAFGGTHAAVLPAVGNAGGANAISWAGYLFDYARWNEARPPGNIPDPLIYNAAYRRERLIEFGDRLEEALDPYSESLWPELFRRGFTARFEPGAQLDHLSVGKLGAHFLEKFVLGMIIAGNRRRRWSWWRRLAYAGGSPLIPFVLHARERTTLRQVRSRHRIPLGAVTLMFLAGVAKAAGECVGYLFGTPAWALAKETDIELDRFRYCRPPVSRA